MEVEHIYPDKVKEFESELKKYFESPERKKTYLAQLQSLKSQLEKLDADWQLAFENAKQDYYGIDQRNPGFYESFKGYAWNAGLVLPKTINEFVYWYFSTKFPNARFDHLPELLKNYRFTRPDIVEFSEWVKNTELKKTINLKSKSHTKDLIVIPYSSIVMACHLLNIPIIKEDAGKILSYFPNHKCKDEAEFLKCNSDYIKRKISYYAIATKHGKSNSIKRQTLKGAERCVKSIKINVDNNKKESAINTISQTINLLNQSINDLK